MSRLLSRRTVRVRLALIYAGLFLLLGTVLIAVILLVANSPTTVAVSSSAHPTPLQRIVVNPRPHGQAIRVEPLVPNVAVQQHAADRSRLLLVVWIVLALTALVSIPLGWFAAGRMLRPVREITGRARLISAGNLHERLELEGPSDEFTELGDTLDDLLARLQASFDAQRRFVANASHELRTPLTVERTLLQVALADPNASAATLRATCEELLAAGRDQERLLDAMLTLTASESGIARRVPVDLATVAARVLAKPRPEVDAGGLHVGGELAPAATSGDPDLLERMIANLVDNAVHHNLSGGAVDVHTGVDEWGWPFVEVSNSGVVIAPVEVPGLFEPFRRLGQQRVGGDNGRQGLGLSIVRAIADAHDATIQAEPGPNGGLTILIRFPAPARAAKLPGEEGSAAI